MARTLFRKPGLGTYGRTSGAPIVVLRRHGVAPWVGLELGLRPHKPDRVPLREASHHSRREAPSSPHLARQRIPVAQNPLPRHEQPTNAVLTLTPSTHALDRRPASAPLQEPLLVRFALHGADARFHDRWERAPSCWPEASEIQQPSLALQGSDHPGEPDSATRDERATNDRSSQKPREKLETRSIEECVSPIDERDTHRG